MKARPKKYLNILIAQIKLGPIILRTIDINIWKLNVPGILVAATIAMAASFLSEHYGGPVMLFALLLGIAFNFLYEEQNKCMPGVKFSSTFVLRTGVALLGARITFDQIASIGYMPIIVIIGLIILTILFGFIISKLFKLDHTFGLLTGGAVAICGASAALAIASILPKNNETENNTIFTVIGVTTLSTIAMIVYPIALTLLNLDEQQSGFFLGATIHDVAQVVGAGYIISDNVGDVATYTKMLRVALLLPAVFIFSLVFQEKNNSPEQRFKFSLPPFLLIFATIVIINSFDYIPKELQRYMIEMSRMCLVVAVASLGIKTSLKSLANLGLAPVMLIVGETLFLAVLALGSIELIL